MAFYKRVNLVGPSQEKLSGWLIERYAGIGQLVQIKEDDFGRQWTVAESGDQLILESQVDPRHTLNVLEQAEVEVPQAIKRASPGRKAAKAALQSVDSH